MVKVIPYVQSKIKRYNYILIILFAILLFATLARYLYLQYNNTQKTENANPKLKDPANTDAKEQVELYFFFANWCKFCVKAKPEWQRIKNEFNGKVVNSCKVKCIEINCTNQDDDNSAQWIAKYKVKGYPTLFLIRNDKTNTFDANITFATVKQFIEVSTI